MNQRPLVSVIIPTYNRAHLVTEALRSVFGQTFKEYEVIVVDDGSTDGTGEILKSYADRIRYIYQENEGIAGARNRGILLSRGKYIAFLDSDDRWLPEKLERQIAYLEAHPKVGLLCTHLFRYEIGREEAREKCPPKFPKDFEELLEGPNGVPTSTAVVRRDCFMAVGLFDPTLPPIEDWDMWLRIAQRFQMDCLKEVLSENRKHPENTTKDLTKVYRGFWRFYAKVAHQYESFLKDSRAVKHKAISFQYLLGTTYLKEGKMGKALFYIAGSLKSKWSIGAYFGKDRSLFTKAKYLLKPYGALGVSFLGCLASLFIPAWRSR